MKIARQFKFEAAHHLPHHDGKCRRLHGHSYHLELCFTGPVQPVAADNPQSGFVVDFGMIDRLVRQELIDPLLDHQELTRSLPHLPYTSAEYLAAWIVGWCMQHLEGRPEMGQARIFSARLWETANAWAEADRRDAQAMGFTDGAAV